jgi:hypothetical protein
VGLFRKEENKKLEEETKKMVACCLFRRLNWRKLEDSKKSRMRNSGSSTHRSNKERTGVSESQWLRGKQ